MRPMFGSYGGAVGKTSITFVSQAADRDGIADRLGLKKQVLPVANTRKLSKQDMKLNDLLPQMEVDPEPMKCELTANYLPANPRRFYRWLNAISCFNRLNLPFKTANHIKRFSTS
jgi:urease subunit alpha